MIGNDRNNNYNDVDNNVIMLNDCDIVMIGNDKNNNYQ